MTAEEMEPLVKHPAFGRELRTKIRAAAVKRQPTHAARKSVNRLKCKIIVRNVASPPEVMQERRSQIRSALGDIKPWRQKPIKVVTVGVQWIVENLPAEVARAEVDHARAILCERK